MSPTILIALAVGAATGYIAELLFKKTCIRIIGNVVIGILGGMAACLITQKLGVTINDNIEVALTSLLGAMILLLLINGLLKI